MDYLRLKLWFALRVAFFSAVISFPTLASAIPELTIVTFATVGIPIGIFAYHYFYQQERYVFLNLGIRKRAIYSFASIFIWILATPLFLFAQLFH